MPRDRNAARSGRNSGRKQQQSNAPSRNTSRSRYRGAAGREQAQVEQERIRQRREQRRLAGNNPFRFWMPQNSERQVIVLDAEPDFYRYEHALDNPDSNRRDLFTDCIDDSDNCPICENTDSRSYYALYMTVIDLEPYTDRQGNEVEWSRKLFVVKSGMQRTWVREYERLGSLRGRVFTLYRDGDKDPVVGNQIAEADEDPYTENELSEFVREWTDRENKTHTEDCSQPFDYDEIAGNEFR